MKYAVEIMLENLEDKEELTINGTVEFSFNKGDYGNGYHMLVTGLDMPFGHQAYDIRYDKDFHGDMVQFILIFFSRIYDNALWNITGISVKKV